MTGPVVRVCGQCGGENGAQARFCQLCGSPLIDAAGTAEVRKTVTVVFADVTESTALGEQVDPEVLRAVMGEFYDAARAVVARHGGTLEKFVGDAVLAVFGVPAAREDDALRAVRAAVELRAAMDGIGDRFEEEQGSRLAVRIGVNTGEVVVGAARSGGSFATGDAVNTAARLEQAAAPGEVLLGATSYELVRGAVSAVPIDVEAKGKADPVPAWRLQTVDPQASGLTRRQDTAFIGRRRERHILDDALQQAVDARTGALVAVVGDPGVGKTRLVTEFLDDSRERATVLTGRCLSYGDGIALWPVIEIMRQACELDGEEPPETARRRLAAVAAGHPEAASIVAQLAPVLGLGGEPGGLAEVSWAFRGLVEQLSAARPLVLLVDDMHWAEPALLDVLEEVAVAIHDVPVVLVCTARPEFLDEHGGWAGAAPTSSRILLEPLPAERAEELVVSLAGDPELPPAMVRAIVDASGGNPLFVEQMLAHLADHESSATSGPPAVAVPPSIAALLAARLDRLEEADRALLFRAAIIGEVFHVEELAALGDADPDDLTRRLEALTRRTLLRRSRVDGPRAYRFRHALLVAAAYDALPKSARAELHEAFARWLTEHPADSGADTDAFVGHHLHRAAALRLELHPGDRHGRALATEAAAVLESAARAKEAYDQAAAILLLRKSVLLAEESDPRLPRRLLRLGAVLSDALDFSCRDVFVQAGRLCRQHGDDLGARLAEGETATADLLTAAELSVDEVLPGFRRLLDDATAAGDSWTELRILTAIASLHNVEARWGAMVSPLERAIALAARIGEQRHLVMCLRWLVAAARWGPTPVADALVRAQELLPRLEHSPVNRTGVIRQMVPLLAMNGDPDQASHLLGDPPQDATERGTWAFAAIGLHQSVGDIQAAARAAGIGAEAAFGVGALAHASTLFGWQACLLAEAGQDAEALAVAQRAEATSPVDDAMSQCYWRAARAIALAREGRYDEADRLAGEGLAWVDGTDQLNEQADIRRWVALAHDAMSRPEDANRLRAEAVERYDRKGNGVAAERTRALLSG